MYACKRSLHLFPTNLNFICKSVVSSPLSLRYFSTLQEREHQFSISENTQKSEPVRSFFKQIGLSESQLEKIFKCRKGLFTASLDDTIKPKIRIFQDFGFSPDEIAVIITEEPMVLHSSATNTVIPSLSTLKNLMGSSEKVVRVVKNYGYFLTANLEKTMVPNVEFLKSYGVPMENIRQLLLVKPITLLLRPEAFRKIVEMVDRMGVDVSVAKLKGIVEAVIGTGKYSLSCIAKTPVSLGCSLERRIIPRFHVLEKMKREKWPALASVCALTDKKFLERYVVSHLNQVDPKHALQAAMSMLNEGRN